MQRRPRLQNENNMAKPYIITGDRGFVGSRLRNLLLCAEMP